MATPIAATTFNSTLDIAASGSYFWLVARTSDGELVQRLTTFAREAIFRSSAVTAWISVAPTSTGTPMIARGAGTGYNHNFLGCAP